MLLLPVLIYLDVEMLLLLDDSLVHLMIMHALCPTLIYLDDGMLSTNDVMNTHDLLV